MREILTLITQREDLKTHWKAKKYKNEEQVCRTILFTEKRMYILSADIDRNIISRKKTFFF
jgi:hypothetical protein